ncbi:MAG: hypothetical protein AAF549_04865, partial [Pseudomonadota bacterium]
ITEVKRALGTAFRVTADRQSPGTIVVKSSGQLDQGQVRRIESMGLKTPDVITIESPATDRDGAPRGRILSGFTDKKLTATPAREPAIHARNAAATLSGQIERVNAAGTEATRTSYGEGATFKPREASPALI